jgi:pilus assembly protein FimV
LSAALLWAPVGANALGLGKLTLHSGLDEPLSAEIELTSVSSTELKTLRSGLAPRAEFEAAGVEWASHLTGIKYTVVARADGTPVLQLSSDQPIREPFLHFLLQIEWTGGRLIREYTALLDPPYLAASKPAGVEAPATAAPEETVTQELAAAETAPATAPATATTAGAEQAGAADVSEATTSSETQAAIAPMPSEEEASAKVPETAELLGPEDVAEGTPPIELAQADVAQTAPETATPPRGAADWMTATEYGPVKKGDTLWKIAERLRADKSISLEQTMLALMKANKQAFSGNNMNNLKTGKILKTPKRSAVESVSHPRALKEFRAQYDAWQEYKLKLASTSRTVKAVANKNPVAAKGVITQATTTREPPPAAVGAQESTDLLKIVRANLNEQPQAAQAGTPAGSGTEQAVLADRVAMLEDALESKELENKELRERLSHLETQIKNAQRLIEIESTRLAQAQQQAVAAAPKPAAPAPPAAATSAATPTVTPPTPVVKPPPPPTATAPARVAKQPATPVPLEEEHNLVDQALNHVDEVRKFVDEVLNGPQLVPAAGGLGAIVAGTLFLYYRRRRRSMAEFEESILSGGGLNSEGTPSNPNAGSNGDVSLLSEFSQGGMGNIHTDEVDPIAEAEVYLAYGRDEQAEEILREAIVKDPQRQELRQKLLEIYHQRNDLGAFETLAEELYAALAGKGGKVWDKVADMGRKMNPANPMFRGGAATGMGAATVLAGTVAASSMFSVSKAPSAAPASMEFLPGSTPPSMAGDLDFNLGSVAAAAEAPSVSTDFAFDLDLANNAPGAPAFAMDAEPEPAAAPADISLGGLDMDFGSLSLDSSSGGSIDFETPAESSGDDLRISFDAETTENGETAAGGLGEVEWNMDEASLESMTLEDLPEEGDGEAFDGLVSSDEIATKLDLAKAYIDMGDGDGARSILDEVLAEGNDGQKRQAADLAAQIA